MPIGSKLPLKNLERKPRLTAVLIVSKLTKPYVSALCNNLNSEPQLISLPDDTDTATACSNVAVK